jgi:hypothetical protein
MADAESGTAPTEQPQDGSPLPTPTGWEPIPDRPGQIRPGRELLDRVKRLRSVDPRVRKRLATDPEFQAAWQAHRNIILGWLISDDDPGSTRFVAAIDRVVRGWAPKGIPGEVCAKFLVGLAFEEAESLAPPGKIAKLVGRLHPVDIVANVGPDETQVLLRRGGFAMRFLGASGADRRAWDAIIRDAQDALDYPLNEGGREQRKSHPPEPRRTDPRVVARLVRTKRRPADIAEILHAVYPDDRWLRRDETGDEEPTRKRIARFAADGEALLNGPAGDGEGD